MSLNTQDLAILRELALAYAQIAAQPAQTERQRLWRALNDGHMQRPMVLLDQLPWHEFPQDTLACRIQDPYWQGVERTLRRELYQAQHFAADRVALPYVLLPRPYTTTGYGVDIQEETRAVDAHSDVVAHHYENQFQRLADVEQLHAPQLALVPEAEVDILDTAEAAFHGAIPYVLNGPDMHLGLWDWIAQWMGVEHCYLALMDDPDLLHALLRRLVDCVSAMIDQREALGLLDTHSCRVHCSHTFSDQLPTPQGPAKTGDVWCYGMAQLFTSVSPAVTAEFEAAYVAPLFARFGGLYYGCCDRLDDRMDVIATLPNLRKISCSPWSRREAFAERMPRHCVLSNKPNPALLAGTTVDWAAVRQDLQRTVDAAARNGVGLEFILKDVSTVCHDPGRLSQWAEVAMETAQG